MSLIYSFANLHVSFGARPLYTLQLVSLGILFFYRSSFYSSDLICLFDLKVPCCASPCVFLCSSLTYPVVCISYLSSSVRLLHWFFHFSVLMYSYLLSCVIYCVLPRVWLLWYVSRDAYSSYCFFPPNLFVCVYLCVLLSESLLWCVSCPWFMSLPSQILKKFSTPWCIKQPSG